MFGPNYHEIGGGQLTPLRTLSLKHLKEDIRENKPRLLISILEDAWKQLENFSLNFSSCNPFPSWPSAAKDTC